MTTEIAWPVDPPDAELQWYSPLGEGVGELWFREPGTGDQLMIYVTKGQSCTINRSHVWHIDIFGSTVGGTAKVSPSIHYPGHFHSPSPAKFVLVEEL